MIESAATIACIKTCFPSRPLPKHPPWWVRTFLLCEMFVATCIDINKRNVEGHDTSCHLFSRLISLSWCKNACRGRTTVLDLHRVPGPVSQKVPKNSKSFVKLRPANSLKLVFSNVVKGIKIKTTAKFRASRRLRYEDTKRIMSPKMRPKSFGISRNGPLSRTEKQYSHMLRDQDKLWSCRPHIRLTNLRFVTMKQFQINSSSKIRERQKLKGNANSLVCDNKSFLDIQVAMKEVGVAQQRGTAFFHFLERSKTI